MINLFSDMPTFPVGLDVDWHAPTSLPVPNAYLNDWLLHTGSLTERLQSMCRQFELKVIGQHTITPHASELAWLPTATNAGNTALNRNNQAVQDINKKNWDVREVILFGDGQPWVFARSVIPRALANQEFAELNNQPLGKLLFNDDRFQRSQFQLCQLTSWPLTNSLTNSSDESLWGRRSRFHFAGLDMIVAEVFLPDSPAYG